MAAKTYPPGFDPDEEKGTIEYATEEQLWELLKILERAKSHILIDMLYTWAVGSQVYWKEDADSGVQWFIDYLNRMLDS